MEDFQPEGHKQPYLLQLKASGLTVRSYLLGLRGVILTFPPCSSDQLPQTTSVTSCTPFPSLPSSPSHL